MTSKGRRSSGGIYHDVLKFMIARIAEELGYRSVEMEAKGEGKFIPDVVMRSYKGKDNRKPRAYVEVQLDIDDIEWQRKIGRNYKKDEIIVISVEEFIITVEKVPVTSPIVVGAVYVALRGRISDRTLLPPQPTKERKTYKKKKREDQWINYRGHRIKNKYKNKKRIDYIEGRKEHE